MLPVGDIDGSYGDAKVAKKNNGGRNKQCKDIVVVEETSNSLLRGDQKIVRSLLDIFIKLEED